MHEHCLRQLSALTLVACIAVAVAAPIAIAADPPPAADAEVLKRGKLLWLQCVACHDITPVETGSDTEFMLGKVGPSLFGLIDQPAGVVEGYRYSDDLRNSGLIWDKQTLDRWIEEPAAVVPGTLMTYIGMPDEADRRALIAYIESAAH